MSGSPQKKFKNIRDGIKVRHKYQPDLAELLSQCELNYQLLMQLAPELLSFHQKNPQNVKGIHQKHFEYDMIIMSLEFTDIAKYTTTMYLTIKSPKIKLAQGMKLVVRLYHDAKMLEVMEGPGPSALKAVESEFSNGKPVDEKRQINRFVGESIQACLDANETDK